MMTFNKHRCCWRPSGLSQEPRGSARGERQPLRNVHNCFSQGIIRKSYFFSAKQSRHFKVVFVPQVPSSNDDSALADKEAILATLNIKAMTFDDTFSALARSKTACVA